MRAQRFHDRSCGVTAKWRRYKGGDDEERLRTERPGMRGVAGGSVRSAPRRRYIFHARTSPVTHALEQLIAIDARADVSLIGRFSTWIAGAHGTPVTHRT